MARRKTIRVEVGARPESLTPDERASLQETVASLPGEGWKIVLSEYVPGVGESHLGPLEPAEDMLESVGRKYGCGTYVWRVKRPDGKFPSASDGIRTSGRFTLSPKEYPKKNLVAGVDADPVGGGGRDDLFKMMLAQQQNFAMQMQAQQASNQQSLVTIIGALAKREGPDPVAQVAQLYQLAGGAPAARGNNIAEMREMMSFIKEMGGELGGGSDEERKLEMWTRIIETAAPVVEDLFSGRQGAPRPPGAAAGRQMPPRSRPVDNPPAGAAESEGGTSMSIAQKARLAAFIRDLTRYAAAGKDPGLYADLFLDNLDQIGVPLEVLRGQMFDPLLLDTLCRSFAQVEKYREWFAEYLDSVREGWDEVTGGKAAADVGKEEKPAPAVGGVGQGARAAQAVTPQA